MLNVIDYIPSSILEEPFYTVAIQPTYEIGDKAVEMLVARLTDEKQKNIRNWSGGPRIWNNARASLVLPEVRRLIFEERYAEANTLVKQMQYCSASDLDRLERVDSLFPMNNLRHPSKGKRCLSGESVISVDGDGTIRRFHFTRGKSVISTWITGKLRSYAPMKPVVVISTMCTCPIWH